jgi:1-acyl-sn-glycerol-3-phosphate acyltransferase
MIKKAMHFTHNYWILFRCLLATFWIAIKINLPLRSRLKRDIFLLDPHISKWVKNLQRIISAKVTIHNPGQTLTAPEGPTMVMCNHNSFFDIPISYLAFPQRLRMFGKKELFKVPIWGSAMRVAGHACLDRSNPRQALKSLQKAQKSMEQGTIMWICPEGTRSEDGKLQDFKSGGFKLALKSGATIIPMTICGAHGIASKGSTTIHCGQKIDVHIGQAIDTTDYDKKSIDKLMQAVRCQMQEALAQSS